MFALTHPGAHERDAERLVPPLWHWAWLIILAFTALGMIFASALDRVEPGSAQVEPGD